PCGDIPDADRSVITARGQDVVGRKGDHTDRRWMWQPGPLAATDHVPQTNGPSIRDGQGLAVPRERHGIDPCPARDLPDVALRGQVPKPDAVAPRRRQDLAIRREGDGRDHIRVSVQRLAAAIPAEPPEVAPLKAA